MFKRSLLLSVVLSSIYVPAVMAADSDQAQTMQKLIKTLVEQKLISEQKGQELLRDSQTQQANEKGVVKVQQVPQFIQDDIRQKVKNDLQQQVVEDVINKAKNEKWGVPGTLPGWIDNIKFKADLRLRAQMDTFEDQTDSLDVDVSGRPIYWDYNEINKNSKLRDDRNIPYEYNHDVERDRLRGRARIQMDTKFNQFWKGSFRLATGDASDPVSTNQTFGNYGKRYTTTMDLAYLKYDGLDSDNYQWFTFLGGKMPNPFLSTDLVWDNDLNFDGLVATYRFNLTSSEDLFAVMDTRRSLFVTVGAFPLQDIALTTKDKWLYAAQLGTVMQFDNQNAFNMGLALYQYKNITGEKNTVDAADLNYTAPGFMQKGNTLFNIANPSDPASTKYYAALASEYKLLDLTTSYTFANFAPIQVTLTLDFVKNIGFDKDKVAENVGRLSIYDGSTYDRVIEETNGYQAMVTFGWPVVAKARDWNASIAYKKIGADAVVDSFNDSDFGLGGTDLKGWVLGGQYGLDDNVSVSGRFLSAERVDGVPFGVDTFQLDLNAKF